VEGMGGGGEEMGAPFNFLPPGATDLVMPLATLLLLLRIFCSVRIAVLCTLLSLLKPRC